MAAAAEAAAVGAAAAGGGGGASSSGSSLGRAASAPAPSAKRRGQAAAGRFDAARLQLQQGPTPDDNAVKRRGVLSVGKLTCKWHQLHWVKGSVAAKVSELNAAVQRVCPAYQPGKARSFAPPAGAHVVKSSHCVFQPKIRGNPADVLAIKSNRRVCQLVQERRDEVAAALAALPDVEGGACQPRHGANQG